MAKDTPIITPELEEVLDTAVSDGRFATRQEALEHAVHHLDNAWWIAYIQEHFESHP